MKNGSETKEKTAGQRSKKNRAGEKIDDKSAQKKTLGARQKFLRAGDKNHVGLAKEKTAER